jgi:hypothetical protein
MCPPDGAAQSSRCQSFHARTSAVASSASPARQKVEPQNPTHSAGKHTDATTPHCAMSASRAGSCHVPGRISS